MEERDIPARGRPPPPSLIQAVLFFLVLLLQKNMNSPSIYPSIHPSASYHQPLLQQATRAANIRRDRKGRRARPGLESSVREVVCIPNICCGVYISRRAAFLFCLERKINHSTDPKLWMHGVLVDMNPRIILLNESSLLSEHTCA